jgi:hypothetical protein
LIKIVTYDESYKALWDNFVSSAKSSHFFFQRDYMEYHSDRFKDSSFLFFNSKKLMAVLPANLESDTLYSHQGLSFGGLIFSGSMTANLMLEIFSELIAYLRDEGIKKIIYKAIPYIYHSYPAQEDLYALQINGAELYRRDISSALVLSGDIKFQERRLRAVKKARASELTVTESDDYESFWALLTKNLQEKFKKKPVHNLDEIKYLAKQFPDEIKLYLAKDSSSVLAGTILYKNKTVLHTQYLANSEEGKACGALDLIIDYLINDLFRASNLFFDFGISCEDEGKYLNNGLIEQKEGFLARAVVHDFYQLRL